MLKSKSEVLPIFKQFKAMVELQLNTKIKMLQSDNDGEFIALTSFLKSQGIIHRFSCPHTPQQNGTAKRKIRHIIELGLSMLTHASMPLSFWDEAFLTATHIINRLPTQILSNESPYQALYHITPTYNHLKVYGCACFPNLRPYNSPKLQFRSTPCTFIGYSSSHKGYRCLASNGRLFISRDVVFDESHFPYANASSAFSSSSIINPNPTSILSIPLVSYSTAAPNVTNNADIATNSLLSQESSTLQVASQASPSPITPYHVSAITPSSTDTSSTRYMLPHLQLSSPHTTSSTDSSTLYMLPTTPKPTITSQPSNTHTMATRSKCGIFKPKAYTAELEPRTVKATLSNTVWKAAMEDEFTALQRYNTWTLVPLPSEKNTYWM